MHADGNIGEKNEAVLGEALRKRGIAIIDSDASPSDWMLAETAQETYRVCSSLMGQVALTRDRSGELASPANGDIGIVDLVKLGGPRGRKERKRAGEKAGSGEHCLGSFRNGELQEKLRTHHRDQRLSLRRRNVGVGRGASRNSLQPTPAVEKPSASSFSLQ